MVGFGRMLVRRRGMFPCFAENSAGNAPRVVRPSQWVCSAEEPLVCPIGPQCNFFPATRWPSLLWNRPTNSVCTGAAPKLSDAFAPEKPRLNSALANTQRWHFRLVKAYSYAEHTFDEDRNSLLLWTRLSTNMLRGAVIGFVLRET